MSPLRFGPRVGAGLALITATGLLAGCAGSSTESGGEDLTVVIVAGLSAANGAVLEEIFDGYNEEQGRDAVELRLNADSEYDTAQQALLDIAAGSGPDAIRVTSSTYRTMIDSGAAQPVSECLASSPSADDLDADILASLEADGELYQVPWYVTPGALFYNADLFRAAGLDPETPPATMEEVHEAAAAIAATGTGGGTTYFGNDFNFQAYVASAGGTVYDPDSGEVGIDSAAGTRVFDFFGAMSADGSAPVYPNFFGEAHETFTGGGLGLIVTSASSYPAFKENSSFDLRIAPFPYFADGTPASPASINGFVITTSDPERQAATCEALLALVTPEGVTATVEASATVPLIPSLADDPDGLAGFYEADPSIVAIKDQALIAWESLPEGASAEYAKVYGDIQLRVLRGELDGASAAAELQAAVESLLAEG